MKARDESLWNNNGMIQRASDIFYTLCYQGRTKTFRGHPAPERLHPSRIINAEPGIKPGSIFVSQIF
jgi:hypothetical protein